jgi:hypothetical protein
LAAGRRGHFFKVEIHPVLQFYEVANGKKKLKETFCFLLIVCLSGKTQCLDGI